MNYNAACQHVPEFCLAPCILFELTTGILILYISVIQMLVIVEIEWLEQMELIL